MCVGGGAISISYGMYILLFLSHETRRGAVYLNELKLEVVFPSPELTLQELKLKTGGKVHFGDGVLGKC